MSDSDVTDVDRLRDFCNVLYAAKLYRGPTDLTEELRPFCRNLPTTALKNLRSGKGGGPWVLDAIEAFGKIEHVASNPVAWHRFQEIFGRPMVSEDPQKRTFSDFAGKLLMANGAIYNVDERAVGSYLMFRPNSRNPGVTRSILKISKPIIPDPFGMVAEKVRIDGDFRGVSSKGRVINHEHQMIVMGYTVRKDGLTDFDLRQVDGGVSVIALGKMVRTMTDLNTKAFELLFGIHFHAFFEHPATVSKVVAVRLSDADPNDTLSDLFDRYSEDMKDPISVEQAASDLEERTKIKASVFYDVDPETGVATGPLVNDAPPGESMTFLTDLVGQV